MKPGRVRRICVTPRASGVGGMVSFQYKLVEKLVKRRVEVTFDMADTPYLAVLVVGGTRQLGGLWKARRGGLPVVQRLDGMNWLHRLSLRSGEPQAGGRHRLRHYLRAEYGNLILALIRRRLASHIVYQSHFSCEWWERVHGPTQVGKTVIYNGVDLSQYSPEGAEQPPEDRCRVLMVEGSLMGGYEQGLQAAVQLAEQLSSLAGRPGGKPVELMVVGRVGAELRRSWETYLASRAYSAALSIAWKGLVERQQIPAIDRSAHLFYSSDVNAACPNSVIEALACGLPVAAFDTGALPELVTGDAGRIVPYGGDPWKLDPPDISALARAAAGILERPAQFRQAARARAEAVFDLEAMTDAYLNVLLEG